MTSLDLHRKLHEHPFKPFRVHFVDNRTCDVTEPWMVMVGESSAVVVTQARIDHRGYRTALDWRTVSIAHIMGIVDLERNGSKGRDRKRKPA